jgi:hypothetical protein
VAAGWGDLAAGYPLLLADTVRRWLAWTLAGAVVFWLVLAAGWTLLSPTRLFRTRPSLAVALAAGLAWAPLVAVAGYFANRAWGIRPSELATARGLVPNLGLVAGAVAVWAVAKPFKSRIRKLKAMGLTESLETGYRLSQRGESVRAFRART